MMAATPPRRRRAVGFAAEETAAAWLAERGYTVLDRNFTVRQGEVDLVVRNEEVLAFVEVRSRKGDDFGTPEATIGTRKIRRVVTAARHWLARYGDAGLDIRFDVIAVDRSPRGSGEVRHLPAAFEAGL